VPDARPPGDEATPDDGFGPPLRGGPGGTAETASPPPPAAGAPGPAGEGFGPVLRGHAPPIRPPGLPALPKPKRPGRLLARLAILTILLLALPIVLGGALLLTTSGRITRIPVDGLAASAPAMNVLLVGTDSREGLTAEELLALGTEAVDGQRTDTILLLAISGGRAAMLSFPRDLWVERCDGTRGRINTAHALGGAACLVRTVTRTTGVPLTHYAEVNFVGFLRMVDAVGGVSLYLSEPMVDRFAGVDLPEGCVTLDGRKALGFVRARHVDSDLGRIARQQRFLKELVAEIAQPATVLNVPRLFATAHAGASALTADEDLGPVELLKLARGARGMAGGGIASYTVPAVAARKGGAAVLVPAEREAADIFAAFATGDVLGASGALPEPADVTVSVRNGAGIPGLAGIVADELRAQGFAISDVGNANTVGRTVIRHAPDQELAARRLAEAVPGAVLEVHGAGTPLTLVLGPREPSAAPPASPAPGEQPPAPAIGAGEPPADC